MNDDKQRRMLEATRLTRAGKLTEATALIQRTLAGGRRAASAPHTPAPDGRRHLPRSHQPVDNPAGERMHEALPRTRTVKPVDGRSPSLSGEIFEGSHSGSAGERRYQVYVPSGRTGTPLPLVVMLHGGTQGAEEFALGTRMNAMAEQATFLVVYPEQSTAANQMKYWNWFQPANQRRGGGEAALIAGITADVVRDYTVDADRVYVAGFSAGGAMAAVMAATYPDLYAAAGVHSGLAYASAHDVGSAFAAMRNGPSRDVPLPSIAIPLIVFHGDRDQTVNHANASRLVDQWQSAAPQAGTPAVRRAQVPAGRSYTQLSYPDARGKTAMEQWVIHDGGHTWSGGGPKGSYTDPLGPDASAEMACFFQTHHK